MNRSDADRIFRDKVFNHAFLPDFRMQYIRVEKGTLVICTNTVYDGVRRRDSSIKHKVLIVSENEIYENGELI